MYENTCRLQVALSPMSCWERVSLLTVKLQGRSKQTLVIMYLTFAMTQSRM